MNLTSSNVRNNSPCYLGPANVTSLSSSSLLSSLSPSSSSSSSSSSSTSSLEVSNCSVAYDYYDVLPDVNQRFYFYLWSVATPCSFAIITTVGTIGNLLVIYVILSRPAMRSVTNLLLVNLAVADIAFLTVCVPFTGYKYVAMNWPFGDVVCKTVQYLLYVTAYVTIYTLVAITVLRFTVVVHGNGSAPYRTRRNAVIAAGAIWTVSMAAMVPTLRAHQVKHFDENYSYCGIEKGSVGFVFVTFFIFGYALPLAVICVLYLLVIRHLRQHRPETLDQSRSRDRSARTLKLIVVVVLVFGISWLPNHVNTLVAYFGTLPTGDVYEVFRIVWNCMAYGNSCANPFIYHYGSRDFRKSFRAVYQTRRDTRSRRNHPEITGGNATI